MTVESSLSHSEDIFAIAVERVEAGESIDVVLATAPEEMRTELRDLLLLITATHHLQRAPVPQPPAARRAERKAAFLQTAAQMKAETAVPTTVPTVTAPPKAVQKPAAIIEWLRDFWSTVQAGFSGPNLRLAPLVMIILAVWLGAFGFNTVASAAEMDDPVLYPVKQWMDYQKLNLSSEAARGRVYQEIVTRIVSDATDAATELSAVEQVSGAKVAVVGTELLVVEGIAEDYLLFGPLRVRMQYQPNPNINQFVSMAMARMPGTGEQVEVTFQIVPVAQENQLEFEIQGISLQFPKKQLPIGPTPTAEPTATPTATVTLTVTATPCVVSRPAGWVPYAVRTGDSLSAIAQRTGTTVAQLQRVNCIVNPNSISDSSTLFAPAIQQVSTPTTTQPPLAVTLTAISTTVMTPSVDVTATVAPTITVTVAATAVPTMTVTTEATVVPTATVGITPTGTLTPLVTLTPTAVLTETVISTPTAMLTPQPSVTALPTSATTDGAPITATAVATERVEPAAGTPVAPTGTPAATTAVETTTAPEATETTEIEGAGTDSSSTPPAAGTQAPLAVNTPTPTLAGVSGTVTAAKEATETKTSQHTPEPMSTVAPTAVAPTATALPPTAPPPTVAPPTIAPTATNTPVPQNRSPLSGG